MPLDTDADAGIENFLFLEGDPNAKILVITSPPEDPAYRLGKAMTNEEHKFFMSVAKSYGFDKGDFCFLPCAIPIPPECATESQQKKHILEDQEEFKEHLARTRPELIIALGKHAMQQLTGRAVQIGKARGQVHRHAGVAAPVLPMTSLQQCLWFPENMPVFVADFNMAAKLDDNDYDMTCLSVADEQNTNYFWTMDIAPLLAENPKWVAVDTEGTGLEWTDPNVRVLTVQLTIKQGESYVIPTHPDAVRAVYPDMPEEQIAPAIARVVAQIKGLLEDAEVKKIGANIKFDHHHLRESHGIRVKGWFADTQQLAFVVDENMFNKGLDEVVRRWAPEMAGYADHFNATVDKSKMLEHLRKDKDSFLRYSGGDTDGNFRAAKTLIRLAVNDRRNWQTYIRIQLPALIAFAERVEPTGMMVDRDRLGELQASLEIETEEVHTRVLSAITPKVRRDNLKAGLKLTRADLVRDALFTADGLGLTPIEFTKGTRNLPEEQREPSTSAKTHLVYFSQEPLVEGVMRWSKLEKMRTTYVGKKFDEEKQCPTGFWKHLITKNGAQWIHPSFFLHRTTTGRSASANPNAQNFPKRGDLAKAFRSIFIAPPGYKVIEADLSQAEIRVAATQAKEQRMIELYKLGVDIHLNTGCAVSGNDVMVMTPLKKCEDLLMDRRQEFGGVDDFLHKLTPAGRLTATVADFIGQLRYQAKAINFGFLYGMQAQGFKTYAKIEYGIEYTDAQAEEIRANFFREYPSLVEWHYAAEREVYQTGEVRSLHGAVRRLPSIYSTKRSIQREAVRQAINSPIQRFASDLGIMALWRLSRDAPQGLVMPIAFIHDALVSYAPEEHAEAVGSNVRWYMENNPLKEWFDVTLPLPIIADVSIGSRLNDMKEVSLPAIRPEWHSRQADLSGRWDQ